MCRTRHWAAPELEQQQGLRGEQVAVAEGQNGEGDGQPGVLSVVALGGREDGVTVLLLRQLALNWTLKWETRSEEGLWEAQVCLFFRGRVWRK